MFSINCPVFSSYSSKKFCCTCFLHTCKQGNFLIIQLQRLLNMEAKHLCDCN
uniref:Uncharacterized protein n=1 Tax=Rhizophora mucronata TaxID=61149 RepID=A0A2P2MFH8_RHIMU